MKAALVLFTAAALLVTLAGCAAQSDRTARVPTGPVQTTTTEPNVIPAGTTLAIRTNEAIEAQTAGQTYTATVASTVEDQNGRVLVPQGAAAELVVLDVSRGGTVGTPTLELAVRSITVNGRKHMISTEGTERSGEAGLGRNRRTAEMVGGGAVIGTIIGAIAGGGKGAAIGAATGAAAGATVQVLTRGKEVKVPAETILSFRLDQPWRLNA